MTKHRVQAVERSVDLLFALAEGPLTLTEVVRKTGLSKPTVFRLLATLDHGSLVVKPATENRYMLGPGFLRLLQGVTHGFGAIAAIGGSALDELWEASGETVTIHVRVGLERMCIEELPSVAPIRYVASIGSVEPLHVGSAGKVLLAFMDTQELERVLPRLPLESVTSRTITDPQRLRRELQLVSRRGWAMSDGERTFGAAAVSVPVLARDRLLAALSILGPANRLSRARRLEFVPLMTRAAETIESALGGEVVSKETWEEVAG